VLSPLTGRALSESALAAAPIAAYDLDWQGDLIQTGVTGELVPFREPDQMAVSVARFLRDPAYARAMGRAVREHALAMLDPARLNQHERDQYSRLLVGWP
jgi:glycosyltransferase involved in cell wall biosynthesis